MPEFCVPKSQAVQFQEDFVDGRPNIRAAIKDNERRHEALAEADDAVEQAKVSLCSILTNCMHVRFIECGVLRSVAGTSSESHHHAQPGRGAGPEVVQSSGASPRGAGPLRAGVFVLKSRCFHIFLWLSRMLSERLFSYVVFSAFARRKAALSVRRCRSRHLNACCFTRTCRLASLRLTKLLRFSLKSVVALHVV